MSTKSKSSKAKYFKKWYESHKAIHRANVRSRNQRIIRENQEKIYDYLLEHPCVECGETNPISLDFDHDDPEEKLHAISFMASQAFCWETIEKEIAKCTVRCGNCHRIKTSHDGNHIRWQIWCGRRESNPRSSD